MSRSKRNSSPNQLLRKVRCVFDKAPFVQLLGIELSQVKYGKCSSRMTLRKKHLQHLGRAHGAALAALAGQTALGAATSVLIEGEYVLCPDFKVSLFRGLTGGRLLSSARVIKSGKLLIFVEAEIVEEGGPTNEPLAKASYTFTRLRAGDGENSISEGLSKRRRKCASVQIRE